MVIWELLQTLIDFASALWTALYAYLNTPFLVANATWYIVLPKSLADLLLNFTILDVLSMSGVALASVIPIMFAWKLLR